MQDKWMLYRRLCHVICFYVCVSNAFGADPNTTNICDRLQGAWFGSYTYRNKSDCDAANGCTQGVNIMVTSSNKEDFHVTATHTRAKAALEFEMACKNNKISIPNALHAALDVSCEETHVCIAKYDDEKVFATVMNVKDVDKH